MSQKNHSQDHNPGYLHGGSTPFQIDVMCLVLSAQSYKIKAKRSACRLHYRNVRNDSVSASTVLVSCVSAFMGI